MFAPNDNVILFKVTLVQISLLVPKAMIVVLVSLTAILHLYSQAYKFDS